MWFDTHVTFAAFRSDAAAPAASCSMMTKLITNIFFEPPGGDVCSVDAARAEAKEQIHKLVQQQKAH